MFVGVCLLFVAFLSLDSCLQIIVRCALPGAIVNLVYVLFVVR